MGPIFDRKNRRKTAHYNLYHSKKVLSISRYVDRRPVNFSIA